MSSANVEAVRASMDAWNRGDVDGWLEPSHPEIEWRSDVVRRVEGSDTVYRGRDGLRRYWDEWHALWQVNIDLEEVRNFVAQDRR